MTQRERMDKGMLYNPGADEIMNEQFPYCLLYTSRCV